MSPGFANTLTELAEEIAAGSFRNEAEISQGVVKRVLHEMGWPVFDIRVVAPEFKIGVRKVDYALCHPPGKPAMLVEVKDLGKADEKGEMQLFEYCFKRNRAPTARKRRSGSPYPSGSPDCNSDRRSHMELLCQFFRLAKVATKNGDSLK